MKRKYYFWCKYTFETERRHSNNFGYTYLYIANEVCADLLKCGYIEDVGLVQVVT